MGKKFKMVNVLNPREKTVKGINDTNTIKGES
jgi:hypothetical protein